MTKICVFIREILETTFSAIDSPEKNSSNVQPRQVTSEYCLILSSLSHIYLKEQKEWILFYLHQNALNGQKSKDKTYSFHANSIKILPNIIKCWLLKSFGLMLLLIEKFITHTSPYKYFQPSLLNKTTKASQGDIKCSQIRASKLKTCWSGNTNPKQR